MTVPLASLLLRTKLNRPIAMGVPIVRARLLQKLVPARNRRLTLVSAPAGFGKTTLLVQWLASEPVDNAWLSLGENDDELEIFLAYLVEAIRSMFPEACPVTVAQVYAPQSTPYTHIVYTLINELAVLPREFILVLDDYHRVRSDAIHQLMATLITHAPPNLHLVLSTRSDPPLPLARLRARQELTEVRAADLRFNHQETEAFLADAMALSLNAQDVARLEQQTEGWAVGLQLTALSLRDADDTQRLLDRLSQGEHRYVMDFLVDEVLASIGSGVQDFLHWTALFDRFCPALCDAIGIVASPYQAANEVMAELERSNLFLVRLDNAGEWFRYHHLFRRILRLRLRDRAGQTEVVEMHRRASRWFASQGWTEEALEHALAAEELIEAAELVERSVTELLNLEDWRNSERLLGQLPEAIVQQRPALLMAHAWTLVIRAQPEGLPSLLAAVEAELAGSPENGDADAIDGQLCALRASMLLDSERGEDETEQMGAVKELSLHALHLLPKNQQLARRFAISSYAAALLRTGRGQEGVALLEQILATEGASINSFTEGVFIMLSVLYAAQGDLDGMERIIRRQAERRNRSPLLISAAGSSLVIAAFFYFRYRLQEAQSLLESVLRVPYGARPGPFVQSGILLALIYELQGESARADEVMGTLSEYVVQDGGANLPAILESAMARLHLMRGKIDLAERWAIRFRPKRLRYVNEDIEAPLLTYIAVKIAQGTPASLRDANALIGKLIEETDRIHFVRYRLQVQILLVATQAAQGDEAAGLASLQQAIELARPGYFIVFFIEQGESMRRLLHLLSRRTPDDDFIRELLAEFPAISNKNQIVGGNGGVDRGLAEDLSRREGEILRLLEQGWSNTEIAGALVLSPTTVKRHIANIYQKLGVNNRTKAVRRGRELGILPAA